MSPGVRWGQKPNGSSTGSYTEGLNHKKSNLGKSLGALCFFYIPGLVLLFDPFIDPALMECLNWLILLPRLVTLVIPPFPFELPFRPPKRPLAHPTVGFALFPENKRLYYYKFYFKLRDLNNCCLWKSKKCQQNIRISWPIWIAIQASKRIAAVHWHILLMIGD